MQTFMTLSNWILESENIYETYYEYFDLDNWNRYDSIF